MEPKGTLIANEFAAARVSIDNEGNGPRLKIEDTSSGVHVFLDPLELQALAWATHRDLAYFASPSFREQAYERVVGELVSGLALEEAQAILRRLEQTE
jgi:hypothetical protein